MHLDWVSWWLFLPPLALLVITGIIVEDFLLLGYQVVTVPVMIFLAGPKVIGVGNVPIKKY